MDLIINLTKEELRNFKLSLRRVYANNTDNRLSKLANAYRVGKYKNDQEILETIFPDLNKNAFYKLKNKLQNEIYKSLLTLNYGKDDINALTNQLLLARVLIIKSDFEGGYKLLKKAVKKANEIEAFDMLLCVLNEILVLSRDFTPINVPQILEEKRNCINQLTEINYINDKLAECIWRLRKSNLEQNDSTSLSELEHIENKIEQKLSLKTSTTLQLQLQVVVRNILLKKQKYTLLVNYLKNKIQHFVKNNIFNKGNFRQKIVMQVWIINNLYFLKKFEAVIVESDILEQYLLEHNKVYFKTFYWTLVQSKTIANYYLNKPKQAITMLESAIKNIDKDDANIYKHPIQFNFAVINFSIRQYKTGHKYLNFLNDKETDSISNKEFLINMKILDILFYYELKDMNFALYKLDQLKNKHKKQLNKPQNVSIKEFVNILQKIIKKGYLAKTFKTICQNYIEADKTIVTNRGINYGTWLEAKLNKEDYYQFLLQKHKE